MTVIGLDLNGTLARAVSGPEGVPPRPLALDDSELDLPLALSLEGRRPEVGRAGAALTRELPHLVCQDFLPHLGTTKTWVAGRHRLDASRALALVLERLRSPCGDATALGVALPPYLGRPQAGQVAALARKARLPLAGTVVSSLALAQAAYADQAWSGLVLLVEADDHALSWTLLRASADQIQVMDGQSLVTLNVRNWKTCLLDALADCCVRHSRRDPRDSGAAEQLLYEQLDDVLEASQREHLIEVVVRTSQWCQNLILQPAQIRLLCNPMAEQASDELKSSLDSAKLGTLSRVLVSASAHVLPGLVAILEELAEARVPLTALPPESAAWGAHELAVRFHRGDVPREHLDRVAPPPRAAGGPQSSSPDRGVIPIAAVER
jgi:hypothetical protein